MSCIIQGQWCHCSNTWPHSYANCSCMWGFVDSTNGGFVVQMHWNDSGPKKIKKQYSTFVSTVTSRWHGNRYQFDVSSEPRAGQKMILRQFARMTHAHVTQPDCLTNHTTCRMKCSQRRSVLLFVYLSCHNWYGMARKLNGKQEVTNSPKWVSDID